MSYQHIGNLYRDQRILLFRDCYALEKIHGTSAHISWTDGRDNITGAETGGVLQFSSGGSKHATFVKVFDEEALRTGFKAMGHPNITVYGEAYGGSQQGQKWRYGDKLRFIAFEVRIGEYWLAVPQAEDVVQKIGLEFVHYKKIPTDLEALDAERDAPSEQARRNGVTGDPPREGGLFYRYTTRLTDYPKISHSGLTPEASLAACFLELSQSIHEKGTA